MRPELVAVLVAIVPLILARGVARRWVRDRWLDDTISGRQAAILFWLLAAAPLLLLGLAVLIASPTGGLLFAALLVFVLLPMTTLMVAVVDYGPTHHLKESLRSPQQR